MLGTCRCRKYIGWRYCFAAETANYTNTITGDSMFDGAYEDIIDENGVYKFTQDTQITHNQYGVELMETLKSMQPANTDL